MNKSQSYYRGKRVLITGGAGGIGKLMADRIADAGGELVLWDIDAEALARAQDSLIARGASCASQRCDVSDREMVKQVAQRVLDELGPVDILINNAGVVSGKLLLELSERDIERTFAINTLALFWTTRAFLPAMMERGAGHIVTIASAAGLTATVRQSDYAASKHAAVGFDESLRCELRYLGYDDIRTTVVCPYYIATGMFEGAKPSSPLLPVASPERTASQIVDSIARGRRRLFLPPLLALSYLGRLLTTDLFDASMRTLGVPRSMDAFTGRALGRES